MCGTLTWRVWCVLCSSCWPTGVFFVYAAFPTSCMATSSHACSSIAISAALCVQELGILSFSSVLVTHCKHSFGFRLVTSSGKRFVFSGDTEKCQNVIEAARGADVLVHEATFENHLEQDAKFKKHSTIQDAISVRLLPGGCQRQLLPQIQDSAF